MVNARPRPAAPAPRGRPGARLRAWARRHAVLWAVLGVHVVVWTGLNQMFSPHPDTIDHWVQSRVWSLGYAEHPPMVAWLLALATGVLGSSQAALETIAQGANLLVMAGDYALAAWLFGPLAAAFTVVFLEATVYFTAGSTVFQIDQPLMLFWLAALACLLAYRRTGRGRWLLAMGVCAGLGGLSKYTMVLFYLGLGAWMLLVPGARREWRNPYQYLGGLAALAVVSPVVAWNARHDWVSFRYQLDKATGDTVFGLASLAFVVGAVLLFSAVVVGWGAPALWRRWRQDRLGHPDAAVLAVMGLAPLAFFVLVLLQGSFSDPKWANVGMLALFPLFGREAAARWRAGRRRGVLGVAGAAYGLNVALLGLVVAQALHPFLPLPRDPTDQVVAWERTGRQVHALLREQGIPPPEYVVSMFYPLASQFALHLPGQPLTHSLERPRRNLWSPREALRRDNTVFVCRERCSWLHSAAHEQLGVRLEAVGRVRTRWLGVPRHTVRVFRMAAPAPDGPSGRRSPARPAAVARVPLSPAHP